MSAQWYQDAVDRLLAVETLEELESTANELLPGPSNYSAVGVSHLIPEGERAALEEFGRPLHTILHLLGALRRRFEYQANRAWVIPERVEEIEGQMDVYEQVGEVVEGELVDALVGEATPMTADEAKLSVERTRTHLEAAAEEVVRQINGRAWLALGYESWDEMREAEYKGAAVIVPRADRPELVARLRQESLSQKQIGDTLGVAESTVRGDIRDSADTEQPAIRRDALGRERPTSYKRPDPKPESASDMARAIAERTRARREAAEAKADVPRKSNGEPMPQPSDEAKARHEAEKAAQISRETASDNLVRSVWLLSGLAAMEDPVEVMLRDWQEHMDTFPVKTTAARMKVCAEFLVALAERWPK